MSEMEERQRARLFHDLGTLAAAERDQARADVLKLRDRYKPLSNHPDGSKQHTKPCIACKLLADTEHYEQFRTISPPGSGLDGLLADIQKDQ